MHCVIHKCIMVKERESKNTSSMQETRKFNEIRENLYTKVWENKKFCEIGGNVAFLDKIGGKL